MKKINVDGYPDLGRDSGSGAIVNTNVHSYEQYMEAYKKRIEKENRLDKIEEEIGELKDLLQQVLNHINT